jgi:NAD(P)-dependent dehydrogenase (short-subunit alcohol dehydrogenase family)
LAFIYGKVAVVVGASSGMGKACAEYLRDHGYYVYGTSRKASFPDNCDYRDPKGFLVMMPLDVTQEASIARAFGFVIEVEGRIDILLNCAGYAFAGAIEEVSREEAHKAFETNFFGIMDSCRHALPYMRNQERGLIVNISSVAGFVAVPFQGMYSASKYALEAMTEALRMEVKPFGIKVAMLAPGDIKSGFTASRETAKAATTSQVYRDRYEKAVNEMIRSETAAAGPEIVVAEFAKILNDRNPPIRRVVGGQYKALALLKRLLPPGVAERIVEKMY